ncbi:hypothetical protein BJV74DRAFT_879675 [Russula compacta]|nr:hypothetical protein BJV74DRAFT_879675 [Russula compacta]
MVNPLGSFPHTIYTCPTCFLDFCLSGGLTQHQNSAHQQFMPQLDNDSSPMYQYHPHLTAKPCDERGEYLLPHTRPQAPPSLPEAATNSWNPFNSHTEFDFAHYQFVEVQNLAPLIDKALDIWAATVMEFGGDAPWKNSKELYATIDTIQHGDSPWKVYNIHYQGPCPQGTPPKWMTQTYELCAQDTCQVLHHQVETTQFKDSINLTPYQQFNELDEITKDESTHGAMFVPVVAGSDKTMVSVTTGHQEYHPVYMSPGNLTNIARRAHGNALLPVAFLPIPKIFCWQMYHACLAQVFQPLKAGMTTPEVVRCPDGHFCQAIYGLGPYIADYPEQVWLATIMQGWCPKCDAKPNNLDMGNSHLWSQIKTEFLINNWDPGTLWTNFGVHADIVPFTSDFPHADIHELLLLDLLHQVIKGMFKDHIVIWVNEYLLEVHGEAQGLEIIADIDHWLVYLAAIAGHIPSEVVKCLSAFLDFCQIAHHNAITSDALNQLKDTLDRFHYYWEFFVGTAGINGDFISLPWQHSLLHYLHSIQLFGSLNGLCSSITESKHIKAVKEPWWHSSHYNALVQMLQTLCRLDKLATARQAFLELGMMDGTTAGYAAMIQAGREPQPRAVEAMDEDDDNGPIAGPKTLSSVILSQVPAQGYPTSVEALAAHIEQPQLPELLWYFLYDQLNPDADISADNIPINQCPIFTSQISVNLCGAGGMYQERICSNPNWRDEHARHDTVFIEIGQGGMQGMVIGHVRLFFSFAFGRKHYPCALIEWLIPGDDPDEDTGMWVVRPEYHGNGQQILTIVHLDCISRAAHLLPVFGSSFIPDELHFSDSLDIYCAYFVNNNIDHHCHEFLS